MRKFIRAFRKARIYAEKWGGGEVFWNGYDNWIAVPKPKRPGGYQYQFLIERNNPFWHYMTKQ